MSCCVKNIINQRFGRLVVVEEAGRNKSRGVMWMCKCDCGEAKVVLGTSLRNGITKSCGCLQRERASEANIGEGHPLCGKSPSKETRKKMSRSAKYRFSNNINNPNYKGGVEKLGIPLFDTFAYQIEYAEETKPVFENDFKMLSIRCAYCGKWFVPTILSVRHRIAALRRDPNGRTFGECRFYCSENCKIACPTYRQRIYPKGFKHATSREVDPHLRQMVFERDNWTCQKCGKTVEEIELHCHHMDPVAQNPMFQNDMDSCISLCKDCHKEAHSQYGCRYIDLRCKGGV